MSRLARNKLNSESFAWLIAGLLAIALTHGLALGQVPGLHYDEAWAANFSHRIASEAGFWPFQAMSPYATSWSHYVAAAFFRIFGTSLAIYRASGIALVLSGAALFSAALRRLGQSRAAEIFPFLVAFTPALVLNHRFGVEITTFHFFCAGVLAYAATRIQDRPTLGWSLAAAASLIGLTSHILFLAPALAALGAVFLLKPERITKSTTARGILLAALIATGLHFLRVHRQIPEKEKTLALMSLSGLLSLAMIFPILLAPFHLGRGRRDLWLLAPLGLLAIPSLFFLFFFFEGSWNATFFAGHLAHPLWILWPLLLLAIIGVGAEPSLRRDLTMSTRQGWLKAAALIWILSSIITALIEVKPAPRYFEIPMLGLTASAAIALSRLSIGRQRVLLALWIGLGSATLAQNYFQPALARKIEERSFRFLFFRDNSEDNLPEQWLASDLGRAGCALQQIRSGDSRLMESLQFLSLGDWGKPGGENLTAAERKLAEKCSRRASLRVERGSQAPAPTQDSIEIGPFRVL